MSVDEGGEPSSESGQPEQRIWNPDATAIWSIFLTPIFGAYLQSLNWETLGEPERARVSRNWAIAGLVVFTALVLLPPMEVRGQKLKPHRVFQFCFLMLWYFASSLSQWRYVRRKYGKDYPRRPWGKPLAATFAFIFFYSIALGLMSALGQCLIDSELECWLQPPFFHSSDRGSWLKSPLI